MLNIKSIKCGNIYRYTYLNLNKLKEKSFTSNSKVAPKCLATFRLSVRLSLFYFPPPVYITITVQLLLLLFSQNDLPTVDRTGYVRHLLSATSRKLALAHRSHTNNGLYVNSFAYNALFYAKHQLTNQTPYKTVWKTRQSLMCCHLANYLPVPIIPWS